MKRTRIKICGISTIQDALAAVHAGADAIGLVFVQGSPRQVDVATADQIIAQLPAFVEPIALFVDASLSEIQETTGELNIRTIQMHGKETPEQAAAVTPLRVIKALTFNEQLLTHDWTVWRNEVPNVTGLLVDSPPPPNAMVPGGHGKSFDWDAMNQAAGAAPDTKEPQSPHHQAPIILAGGLTPRNVAQAIRTVEPYAVDVSSGVESSRGVKDPSRIRAFCAAVRQADQAATSLAR